MKFRVYFEVSKGSGAVVNCTHFSVSPWINSVFISNGLFDRPHLLETKQFIDIRFLDYDQMEDKVHYNSIEKFVEDFNLKED